MRGCSRRWDTTTQVWQIQQLAGACTGRELNPAIRRVELGQFCCLRGKPLVSETSVYAACVDASITTKCLMYNLTQEPITRLPSPQQFSLQQQSLFFSFFFFFRSEWYLGGNRATDYSRLELPRIESHRIQAPLAGLVRRKFHTLPVAPETQVINLNVS